MNESYAIRGGEILVDGEPARRDLLIYKGSIAEVGESVDGDVPTIDASGLLIMPGAIDAHVHFRDPGHPHKESFESGSIAALAGGVTSVFDMPNTSPPTITLEALEAKRALAKKSCHVNYGLYFGLTDDNYEVALQAPDVVGVKIYLAPSTGDLFAQSDGALDGLFRSYKRPIVVHAETLKLAALPEGKEPEPLDHGRLRPVDGAVSAIERVARLAKRYGSRLHIAHVGSGPEAQRIAQLRADGVFITAEVTPHHLLLDEDYVIHCGCRGKVNPPLRTGADRRILWDHLRRGEVDMIATDHAPHRPEEKDQPYAQAPAGIPGVDLFMQVILEGVASGELSLAQAQRVSSEAPARIFGLPRKGRIDAGCDADLVLVDLEASREVRESDIRSHASWSPYIGRTLRGWPRMTFVGGRLACRDGEVDTQVLGSQIVAGDAELPIRWPTPGARGE